MFLYTVQWDTNHCHPVISLAFETYIFICISSHSDDGFLHFASDIAFLKHSNCFVKHICLYAVSLHQFFIQQFVSDLLHFLEHLLNE